MLTSTQKSIPYIRNDCTRSEIIIDITRLNENLFRIVLDDVWHFTYGELELSVLLTLNRSFVNGWPENYNRHINIPLSMEIQDFSS